MTLDDNMDENKDEKADNTFNDFLLNRQYALGVFTPVYASALGLSGYSIFKGVSALAQGRTLEGILLPIIGVIGITLPPLMLYGAYRRTK